MSDERSRESLSALVDGELAPADAARLLDAMRDDPSLREAWRRHHALSAALSGHPTLAGADLAGRVRTALEHEPVPLPARPREARPGRGLLAVAACLALAAVVVVLFPAGEEPGAPVPRVAATDPVPAAAAPALVEPARGVPEAAAPTRLTWNDARPGVEARLNGYLLTHNEYLAGGVRGMLPYARIVGYDPGR